MHPFSNPFKKSSLGFVASRFLIRGSVLKPSIVAYHSPLAPCLRSMLKAFDDSKTAGRLANKGIQKLEAFGAGLGDKLNDGADKAVNKARAFEVHNCFIHRPLPMIRTSYVLIGPGKDVFIVCKTNRRPCLSTFHVPILNWCLSRAIPQIRVKNLLRISCYGDLVTEIL